MTTTLRGLDCDCGLPIWLIRGGGDTWRVQHGRNLEHVRRYEVAELFVTTGYRPWVRELHARTEPIK